jgi:type IV pilus assembly protein PilW
MRTSSFNRKFARGFSLVELMVAMVIGLIGMIIIFQVFEVSEGIKRTTTSGGDAQQNGAVAMYVLEHDVRNSGMGVNDTPWAGCSMIGYDNLLAPPDLPAAGATMLLVPVRIVPGVNSRSPDEVTIIFGSQTHSAGQVKLDQTMNQSTDPVRVKYAYGFNPGDLILVMQYVQPAPPALPKPCSLMEVTAVNTVFLSHDVGNYTYTPPGGAPVTVPSRFNKPGGLGVTYETNKSVVYNLGNVRGGGPVMPVYSTYRVQNSTLTVTSAFTIGTPPGVADNIVHMRAVYGLDDGIDNTTIPYNAAFTAGDGMIDRFVDGATVPNWAYVKAVRIAIVARSGLKEKPTAGVSAPCDTTTTEPTWSGSAWAAAPRNFNTRLDVSADPDWMCYRYRVFEATIPLRNWVWSSRDP